jgi:hypothetical protein
MSFFRPYVLSAVGPRGGYEFRFEPGIVQMGWKAFLSYAAILVLIHHFMLFMIEAFRFSALPFTLLKIVLSSLLTLVYIVIIQFLFDRSHARS